MASGNSAILLFLTKVTFFTSRKHFSLLLEIKKSNLVLSENFTSVLMLSNLIRFFIFFDLKLPRLFYWLDEYLSQLTFYQC